MRLFSGCATCYRWSISHSARVIPLQFQQLYITARLRPLQDARLSLQLVTCICPCSESTTTDTTESTYRVTQCTLMTVLLLQSLLKTAKVLHPSPSNMAWSTNTHAQVPIMTSHQAHRRKSVQCLGTLSERVLTVNSCQHQMGNAS